MKKKNAFKTLCIMAIVLLFASAAYASEPWVLMQSGTKQKLNSVSGLSDGTVYTVGRKGTILKYDGSGWSRQESGTTLNLNNVWAGANAVYAVGDYRGIFMSSGSTWSAIHNFSENYPLYGICGPDVDNGKIIAVGKSKVIRLPKTPRYYHNILDGTAARFRSQPQHEFKNDFYGAFYSEADQNVLMVGSKGIIGWYTGYDSREHNTLETWVSPVSTTLRAIWAVDSQNFFAVGDGGVIVRKLNDGAITTMTSNTKAKLGAVWGTDMNNVYAVGARGTLMHFNGIVWSKIPVPTKANLNGIWGVSEDEIYAVGNKGTIITNACSQKCFCADGSTSKQYCTEDGTGWETCECLNEYSYWNDPDTNLSWQDPQKDAYVPDYPGLTQPDALRYCDELVMGGYDDWRLPDIDELRTLVRGNPSSESDGDCPVHVGSPKKDMEDPACVQAPDYEGPGSNGCYWVDELTGPCDRKDPADEGDRALETVSSTLASDDSFWVADVLFDQGSVVFNHIYSLAEARCVRDGPTEPILCDETQNMEACVPSTTRECSAANGKIGAQVCAEDGLCWLPCDSTSFVPSPPVEDVSEQCDQVRLTLNVPEKFESPPQMLLAFLYKAEGWSFPPARPPDGGTDYNQVLDPDIDLGKPLEMNVPACSYYRDRCIPAGEYYLYVGLLQSNEWPPWPAVPGDYSFGAVQEPLMLNDGPRQVIEMEILLEPYEE